MPLALGVGPHGKHQHVVGDLLTILGDYELLSGIDALKSSAVPGSAGFGGGVLKPQAACALRLERLVDGHRMVDELQLRRKESELHAIAGQHMQRQERLES